MVLLPWSHEESKDALKQSTDISTTTKKNLNIWIENKYITAYHQWKDELVETLTGDIIEDVLSLSTVQEKLERIDIQWGATRIPNIGNYNLGSTIQNEYKNIIKCYKTYHEGKISRTSHFKEILKKLWEEGRYTQKMEFYYQTIERVITEQPLKKFLIRAKPLITSLVVTRIIARDIIANIRYNEAKEECTLFKEGNPTNYEIIQEDCDIEEIFVPKNSINIHILNFWKEGVVKKLLEGVGLIKDYLERHQDCPWFFVESWLLYSFIKHQPNITKRMWLNEQNLQIDEKSKTAKAFVSRETFLSAQS